MGWGAGAGDWENEDWLLKVCAVFCRDDVKCLEPDRGDGRAMRMDLMSLMVNVMLRVF